MRVNHVGYAVKNIKRAKDAFEVLGFCFESVIEDPDRNVYLCFGQNGTERIELVSPLDRNSSSPVDLYLGKTGPVPYHICYESEDLAGDTERLTERGFRVTVPAAEAIAFGGRKVVFMMHLGLGLIELLEDNEDGTAAG